MQIVKENKELFEQVKLYLLSIDYEVCRLENKSERVCYLIYKVTPEKVQIVIERYNLEQIELDFEDFYLIAKEVNSDAGYEVVDCYWVEDTTA